MRFSDVRVFVQVIDSGSLTAAARALGLPVSVVSRRLARLERALEVTLVHRSTRSLSASDEGMRLYPHAVSLLDAAARAVSELRGPSQFSGRVRVAMLSIATYTCVLKRLDQMLQEHPELSIELHVSDRPVALIAGGFDCAIFVGQAPDSFVARRLFVVQGCLAAAPSYVEVYGLPQTVEALVDHHCLPFVDERVQTHWDLVDADGERHRVPVRGRFACSDSRTLREAVETGMGIGLYMPGALKERGLVRVLPGVRFEPMTVWGIYPPARRGDLRVRALLDALAESLRDL